MFTHVPARDLIRGHLRRPGIGRHQITVIALDAALVAAAAAALMDRAQGARREE